ncbi:hypothetical protein Csa_013100 [Cucumis sativus]|uniref:Uncharacterized protein n=1 Tax=Cucumis sativus TaxID=3659 RepID=A0A0A0LTS0_CUCSA|nr:hypothetical protein Csa_013100 [Cucumis sativus]
MVSKVEETLRRKYQQVHPPQTAVAAVAAAATAKQIQCNKAKYPKFKRSSSNVEEDGASSAMLLLACIAFAS